MNSNRANPANPMAIAAGEASPLTYEVDQLRFTMMAGWRGDGYLLPSGEKLGEVGDPNFISAYRDDEAYRAAGTLEEWQRSIGNHAYRNSRLCLMLGAAFGAPLLSWFDLKGAIIHLYGTRRAIQNAMQRTGQSVWGHGYKALVRGSGTHISLERTALTRNDGLLSILEEVDASNAHNLGVLAMNKTRGRMPQTADCHAGQNYRLFVTSMGAEPLNDLLDEKSGVGRLMPLISIPCKLEYLDDFADETALADWIWQYSSCYYGTAGRLYMQHLLKNRANWQQTTARYFKESYEFLPWIPVGKEEIARIFALMATGLRLAIRLDILSRLTEQQAMSEIMQCFYDTLEVTGENYE